MEAFMGTDRLSETAERFGEALKNREFHVWYQPQVDMRTGVPRGAEALVRWQRQDSGLVRPDEFIPLLEKAGLTALLDAEVMRIVCQDISESKQRKIPFGPVSVNLSRLHAERLGDSGAVPEAYRTVWSDPARSFF